MSNKLGVGHRYSPLRYEVACCVCSTIPRMLSKYHRTGSVVRQLIAFELLANLFIYLNCWCAKFQVESPARSKLLQHVPTILQ